MKTRHRLLATALLACAMYLPCTTSVNAENNSNYVVVLDPGHGGSDPGAFHDWGNFVIHESKVNLKISTYTKQALEENYSNVTVYMTRTTNDAKPELNERVNFALKKNADILISQHVNSTASKTTTVHGVASLVPQVDAFHTYKLSTAKESIKLGNSIRSQLELVGFKNNGYQFRLSETGNTYPDGSTADYYQIVYGSRRNGLVGIIMEHGFANNYQDALKLSNEATLKRIGQASATGIANYLGLTKKAPKTVGGWQYQNKAWYYLDPNGKKCTGWLTDGGKKYYLHPSTGVMQTGWQWTGKGWYFFDSSGAMKTGWLWNKGYWYYLDSTTGKMQLGWLNQDGKTYYLSVNSGAMITGWKYSYGHWYYFTSSGAMKTGWLLDEGHWYYLNSNGRMAKGWLYLDDGTYYLGSDGAMLTGTVTIDNKTYTFNKSGRLQK